MKILHITPDLNFLDKFVFPLAINQLDQGAKVEVASCNGVYEGSENLIFIKDTKIQYREICLKPGGKKWAKGIFQFCMVMYSSRPDVVILHTSTLATIPLLILAIFHPGPVRIYFNHGVSFLGYPGFLGLMLRIIEKINTTFSHFTYTVSKSMESELLKISNKSRIKFVDPGSACGIILKYNSIDAVDSARRAARKELELTDEDKVLLFVGRPTARKGLWDLISAWEKLCKKTNIKLFLVGPTKKDILKHGLSLGHDAEVFGYQKDPSLFFLAADVLCVPSYHEGLGYTYLEAASFGCIPVCSNIPGPTDFIRDGITGFTVAPGDIDCLADKLSYIFFNPNLCKQIRMQAFNNVKIFQRNLVVDKVCASINKSIENLK